MAQATTDSLVTKQIHSHQTYLRYAMEHFTKQLETIKTSITNSVMEELRKKDPKLANREMAKQVKKMVDEKLSILGEMDFED